MELNLKEFEESLLAPSPSLVEDIRKIEGDIMFLGIGGKMGPSMAKLAIKAIALAGIEKKVIGVSRFSSGGLRSELENEGIETIACDLLDEQALKKLPQVPNIIYLAGHKFGTTGTNLFGNGLSSSPSRHAAPEQRGASFPFISILDNVIAHWRLLDERFGVERIALGIGWSMGALQVYQHAASFPARVERLLAIGGAARASPHNRVFLEGVKAALLADGDFAGGHYTTPPRRGLEAFGRVYAGWAYSQAFFRDGLYRELGHASPEALLDAWAEDHAAWDANDLLAMLHTWQGADISANAAFDGDFARALSAIEARAIVMPVSTDLYFPPEDSRREVARLRRGELRVIESPWGHVAAGPDRDPAATAAIEAAIRDLLGS